MKLASSLVKRWPPPLIFQRATFLARDAQVDITDAPPGAATPSARATIDTARRSRRLREQVYEPFTGSPAWRLAREGRATPRVSAIFERR